MVTDRFIQICPSRTGSSTIKKIIYAMAADGRIEMIDRVAHTSYKTNVIRYTQYCHAKGYVVVIPPVVCSIRNPWAWYVSKWWFGLERSPDLGFASTFAGHLDDVRGGRGAESWNFGTWTNAWNHVGGDHADYVRRYEDYADEAVRVWSLVMPDLVDKTEWYGKIEKLGKFECGLGNTGKQHRPYQEYYTPETRRWAAEWDAAQIERWGYSFD